jgi:hypothetical protein
MPSAIAMMSATVAGCSGTDRKIQACVSAASTLNALTSNENKMSDGGRERASLGVNVWKSSQNVDAERSVVRSIAWLDVALATKSVGGYPA